MRKFQCRLHLDASGYSPAALSAQITDLDDDFPSLYTDSSCSESMVWIAERCETLQSAAIPENEAFSNVCIGCVGISAYELADVPTAELEFLSVSMTSRRAGLGGELVRRAMTAAVAAGYKRMRILTLKGIYADACRLYERLGFILVEQALGNDWFHIVWYERDLDGDGSCADTQPPPHHVPLVGAGASTKQPMSDVPVISFSTAVPCPPVMISSGPCPCVACENVERQRVPGVVHLKCAPAGPGASSVLQNATPANVNRASSGDRDAHECPAAAPPDRDTAPQLPIATAMLVYDWPGRKDQIEAALHLIAR